MRMSWLFILLAASLAVSACRRREQPAAEEQQIRERELNLFLSAIRAVQDRFVDVDQVQLDSLLSNSLRGMVESIDPYAVILSGGAPAPVEPAPPDAPPVEILGYDDGHMVVVKIFRFEPALRKHLRGLEATSRNRQPSGILIDARDAIGSDYDAALAVAEWFVERGSLVGVLLENRGERETRLITRRQPVWAEGNLVVLIDQETSGPSELLASALKHHRDALLVGEATRGITVIRSPVVINPDWTILLATGRVLDAQERDITGNPVVPDVEAQPRPGSKENIDWIYRRGITALKDLGI